MKDWFTETVGANIKKLRIANSYNQEQLGQLLELSRTSIINIESGRHLPPIKTIYILCAIFKCSYYDILPKPKPAKIHEQIKTKTIVKKKIVRILKPVAL